MIELGHFQVLSAALFAIGLYGVLARKSAVLILMSIELMLNGVNVAMVAFSRYIVPGDFTGHVFAIFIITVAAAEIALGLAIVIAIYRNRESVFVTDATQMRN